MSYSFVWEENGVYWKYCGVLTETDLIRANSELIGNKKIESIEYIIWDASEIEVANLDELAVEISITFSAAVDALNSQMKVAFIALDKHLCGLIENYIDLNLKKIPHSQLKLFNTLDDARTWIST